MSAHRSGGQEDREDTWTSETLPMSVRKELLERELSKLGFHRAEAGGHGTGSRSVQQQQQPQTSGSSSHPQADADAGPHSG